MTASKGSRISRRRILASAAVGVSGFASAMIVPRHVLGGSGFVAPSDTVSVAGIGLGLMGAFDVRAAHHAGARVVALCDVDDSKASPVFEEFPAAKRYRDYRRLLEKEEVDAVIVATPDHTHALISLAAMELGRHVYCEKPLARTLYEVRRLTQAASAAGVATQLGNQGHSYVSNQEFCDAIWSGAIGEVSEVHLVESAFNYSQVDALPRLRESHSQPASLDWDLWLGPAAKRPFHPLYHPGMWRGWRDFGSGMFGDFVCHLVDPVFTALDLGAPSTVTAEVDGFDPSQHSQTFPRSSKIRFEFPERRSKTGARLPSVTLTWYDGDFYQPPRPEELADGDEGIPRLGGENGGPVGGLVVGDSGKILYGSHGAAGWRILPETRMRDYMSGRSRVADPRGTGMPDSSKHFDDFLHACRGYRKAGSNFQHGGPLTEIAALGNIAQLFPGEQLVWDDLNMTFPNRPKANQFLHTRYENGLSF